MEQKTLEKRYQILAELLKSERNDAGFWSGRLSSSALGTAVAIVALKRKGDESDARLIISGLDWLMDHGNREGGFGDTPESRSNVSTSLLCYAAISYCGEGCERSREVLSGVERYLCRQGVDLTDGKMVSSVLEFYGKDLTFSVPILSMLVICGVLDREVCARIPQLPFEFTLFPASWYGVFSLRVVSYAIPALIAVGIFVFVTRRHHNPVMRWIRSRSIQPALRKLEALVPASGGFLEAIPLTAFVTMCLISSGFGASPVSTKGLAFLRNRQRPDGSWPIDTDLSTWVTTLSVNAFGPQMQHEFTVAEAHTLANHLTAIQHKGIHPFNLAQPGGWGWTNFPGSVPDVDDTSGAILALIGLYGPEIADAESIVGGCRWLTTLQNKDGGFPTFCRGWGRLPFDCSCADLTGHAVLALAMALETVGDRMPAGLQSDAKRCIARAIGFLGNVQNSNGSWWALWFGNQLTPNLKNPVYGTARIVVYLRDSLLCSSIDERMKMSIRSVVSEAQKYLSDQQNVDGSWGGEFGVPGTIEESSLAISALIGRSPSAILNGFAWLERETTQHGVQSSPIGLYFAMLWYDEKLYPLIFYFEALRRYLKPAQALVIAPDEPPRSAGEESGH
jgi:squalene-hopene/tetraprenyl-beta-curcumene cyclase